MREWIDELARVSVRRLGLRLGLGLAFIAGVMPSASAQTMFLGRIDVIVQDATGALLPNVSVGISGPQARTQVSDDRGEVHFLNLTPGTYAVTAELSGFRAYRADRVPVAAAAAVSLRAQLAVSSVAESVNVSAEAPIIDQRRQTTTTSLSYDDLQNLPSSRDPWVMLQTVPGVIVDRVNVGGAESGQQSNFIAKGALGSDNTWNVEGVPITDMSATGSSPTYYQFDMFQEMSVTTGGASATNPTGGVQMNLQFKSGTNTVSGAAHGFFANERLQSRNLPDDLIALAGPTGKGNRMKRIYDVGFDIGGPLLRNRWWAWGAYGRTDGTLFTLRGTPNRTLLKNVAFKTTAQLTPALRTEFLYFEGNKVKNGRDASPFRPPETTYDQQGPTPIYKGQASLVAGSTLFLTGRVAVINGGFSLTPQGGLETPFYRDVSNVFHGSYQYYATDRPDRSALVDGSWFRGRHELTFGAGWRTVRDDETLGYPGTGVYSEHIKGLYDTEGLMYAEILRPFFASSDGSYANVYVGDTIALRRVTLNLALRYDRAGNSFRESAQAANPLFPSLLPGITAPAMKDAVSLSLVSPRVGVTYAVDAARKTLVRASYGLFGMQLPSNVVQNFAAGATATLLYEAVDRNRNGVMDAGDQLLDLVGVTNVDPDNPTALTSFGRISPDVSSPRTHEIVVGVDREIRPSFAVSAALTWRRFANVIWQDPTNAVFPLIGVTRADYLPDGTVTGSAPGIGAYQQNYSALPESKLPPGAGREYRNRPGYHQRFLGLEVQATKRMANRWMARVGFSTNDHREYFDDPSRAIQDPTSTVTWPNIDGGVVLVPTAGSGKSDIFLILPKYQLSASGFYQAPWGLGLGANLLARQGYGRPYFEDTRTMDAEAPQKAVLLVDPDDYRLPMVVSLDLRVEKSIAIRRAKLAFDLDLFNLTNRATVLGRGYDVTATGATGYDKVTEVMNPRVARLGLRLQF